MTGRKIVHARRKAYLYNIKHSIEIGARSHFMRPRGCGNEPIPKGISTTGIIPITDGVGRGKVKLLK